MSIKREWLTGLRTQLGMTHQEVADLAKIDRSYYTQIENGTRDPSVTTAQRISDVLKFEWTIFFANKCGLKPQIKSA